MWGGGYGMSGGVMMFVIWGAVIAVIVLAVRGFSARSGPEDTPDAAEALRRRFARGEIDEEEYERRKAALGD